jgi:hypothetical protein
MTICSIMYHGLMLKRLPYTRIWEKLSREKNVVFLSQICSDRFVFCSRRGTKLPHMIHESQVRNIRPRHQFPCAPAL